jgi:Kef-type K+ transport system membrane component KefB
MGETPKATGVDILYILLVLLIATRLAGEVAERLGQPPLLGELIAGVLLGLVAGHWSGTFPILANLGDNEVFGALSDLGVFFLMLHAGLELRPRELVKASRAALIVGAAGLLLPFVLGLGFGWAVLPASDLKGTQALFLGTALAVTAVPVAVRVLMDMGALDSRAGQLVVAAALVDDVLSLVLLAALTAAIRQGHLPGGMGLLPPLLHVAVFFVVAVVLGRWVFPVVGSWLKRARAGEFEFSMLLVGALAYAELAEWLDLHFILGAFFAGLFFGRRTVDPKVYDETLTKIRGLTTGFLAPVFFASVGMHLDLSAVTAVPLMLVGLLVIAIAGKVAGAGLGARLAGLSGATSLVVGFAMNARGAVELIIADVALKAGLFDVPDPPPPQVAHLFSAVVIMALVTTLMTPLALKWAMGRRRRAR